MAAYNSWSFGSSTSTETTTEGEDREPMDERQEEPGIPNSVPGEHYVNFHLAPGEYLIQCPYDMSHRILPRRMATHLFKCRTQHQNKLKEQNLPERFLKCPWDDIHLIPEKEASYHANQCASRFLTQGKKQEFKKYAPKAKKNLNMPELDDGEVWGTESAQYLSYDPKKKMEAQPIFYQPKNLSKAEKKRYREENRLKFYYTAAGSFWNGIEDAFVRIKETRPAERSKELDESVHQAVLNANSRAQRAIENADDGPAVFIQRLPKMEFLFRNNESITGVSVPSVSSISSDRTLTADSKDTDRPVPSWAGVTREGRSIRAPRQINVERWVLESPNNPEIRPPYYVAARAQALETIQKKDKNCK